MGASTFSTLSTGRTAQEAFSRAVQDARFDHGHAGYTGTIAEKHGFVTIKEARVANKDEAYALADKLISASDDRIDDKWGPAGCIVVREADELKKVSKAKALKLAQEKWGPTATLEVSVMERASKKNGGKRKVLAIIYAESDKMREGSNQQLPNGKWRNSPASAIGETEQEALAKLFAQPGEYLFFGWASC